MKKVAAIIILALCLPLAGCGDKLLERSYSVVVPHSAAYWENQDADTLRAENYQDLVNALLLLLDAHSEDGVVRIYGDAPSKAAMASEACVEVQKETPIGAYLLDYITYDGEAESAYYELTVRFGYRRTAEEQGAIVNVTSTEALPDLLRTAIEEGRDAVAIRVGYFGTGRAGVLALVAAVHDEVFPPETAEPSPGAETEDEPSGEDEARQTGEDGGKEVEAAAAVETLVSPVENGVPVPAAEGETPPAEGEAPPDGSNGASPGGAPPDGTPEEPVYDLTPWQVRFYPDDQPGIIEVILAENAA